MGKCRRVLIYIKRKGRWVNVVYLLGFGWSARIISGGVWELGREICGVVWGGGFGERGFGVILGKNILQTLGLILKSVCK